MYYRLLTAMGLLAAAAPAGAEPVQLSSQAIRTTLSGALVNMDTPAGTIIPVRFGTDGLVSGEAGVLAPVLGAKRDRGRWWAERDRLCMKWFRWFEAETRCVSVRMDGEHIFWRGEDRSGTATIIERPRVVDASAPKEPTSVEKATTVQVADTDPTPATAPVIETAQGPERTDRNERAEKLAIRFAEASMGGMSFASPAFKATEPQHLLDAPERQGMGAKSEASAPSAPAQAAAPIPEPKISEPNASKPKASVAAEPGPQIVGAYASSTMVLASFRVAGVDDDDMLNVRSGPAIFYPSVGGLPPEEGGVRIVGPCRADWCPIRHGKMTGWVNRSFLAEETSGPAAASVSR